MTNVTTAAGGVVPRGRSIGETAAELGVSIPTVNRWLSRGLLSAKKAGRKTLVTAESIEAVWKSLPDARFRAPAKKAA